MAECIMSGNSEMMKMEGKRSKQSSAHLIMTPEYVAFHRFEGGYPLLREARRQIPFTSAVSKMSLCR